MSDISRTDVIDSLRRFKNLRDAMLHEDTNELEHHLQRFIEFCDKDSFVQTVLQPVMDSAKADVEEWWKQLAAQGDRRGIEAIRFPPEPDDELALRYMILRDFVVGEKDIWAFGPMIRVFKANEAKERLRSLVIRPLCNELSSRLGNAAHIASPEARALQAVPSDRIPSENESRVFLSHKSEDKPLVMRYYRALTGLGFVPWLDEPEMPAGRNLERALLDGFEQSSAAIFFVTENFRDEKYLATEVDYAIVQKRKKGDKFTIITLLFAESTKVPGLLQNYVFKHVSNDLEGFYEIVRALPVELGPVRWKECIV